jgi:hypothetical protein
MALPYSGFGAKASSRLAARTDFAVHRHHTTTVAASQNVAAATLSKEYESQSLERPAAYGGREPDS